MWRAGLVSLGLLLAGYPASARGETLQDVFRKGNAAFFHGEFDAAIQHYETLIESGVEDPDVYFNLATAYGRRGELGHAVLYFSRAKRLAPGDEDVARYLAATREALAQRAAERTGEATVRTRPPIREALVSGLSKDGLALALLCFDLLLFGALVMRRFVKTDVQRLAAVVIASVSGLAGLLAGVGLALKLGTGQPGEAVVIVTQQTLREGPDPKAQSRGNADEGSLAHALASEGRWVRVRVLDGEDGWLPEEAVGRIDPN